MRQSLAITLLILYLFSSTEIFELLKFPILIQHYQDHQKKHPKISFASYVCEHYTHGDVEDADKEEDRKLPYKNIDCFHFTSFTVLPTVTTVEFAENIVFKLFKAPPNGYNIVFSSDNFSSIWQPPKIV